LTEKPKAAWSFASTRRQGGICVLKASETLLTSVFRIGGSGTANGVPGAHRYMFGTVLTSIVRAFVSKVSDARRRKFEALCLDKCIAFDGST
jgi:hypothetical protein